MNTDELNAERECKLKVANVSEVLALGRQVQNQLVTEIHRLDAVLLCEALEIIRQFSGTNLWKWGIVVELFMALQGYQCLLREHSPAP